MTAIHSSHRIAIERAPADVWGFVVQPANERLWHTDVVEGEWISEQRLAVGSRVRWVMNFGVRRPVMLSIVRLTPGRLLEIRAEHAVMGMQPSLIYEVEAAGATATFTRTIEMTPTGLARPVTPLLRRNVPRSNEEFVKNLKRLLESAA